MLKAVHRLAPIHPNTRQIVPDHHFIRQYNPYTVFAINGCDERTLRRASISKIELVRSYSQIGTQIIGTFVLRALVVVNYVVRHMEISK